MNWEIIRFTVPYTTGMTTSIICASSFVLFIYLDPKTRFGNSLDTFVIQRRTLITVLTCLFSTILVYYYVPNVNMRLLGIAIPTFRDIIDLLVVVILFIGPLYCDFKLGGHLPRYNQVWIVLRALVIAPIFEEYIFRSIVILLWNCIGLSHSKITFLSPLLFGIAHLHHAIFKLSNGHSFISTILVTCFQLLYTTLFGWYQAHVYNVRGNLFIVILVHSFCNNMGFPDIKTQFKITGGPLMYIVGLLGFVACLFIE